MKRFLRTVGGVLLLGGVMSFVLTSEASLQNNFWNEAAMGSMAEIMAGNVALERSQNEQVRQFAQQMIADHTASTTELQTLAAGKNVTLPTAVSDDRRSDIDKLRARTGNDFDRDFMRMMVKDHERMARLFERESERGTDADAKAFAAKNLPVIQNHLTMARSLSDSLRGNNRGNNDSAAMNTNSNRGGNTNASNDANDNANGDGNRFSNLRPNVNRNANGTTNANTNRNTNRTRNTNRDTNANNSNTNNSNVNR